MNLKKRLGEVVLQESQMRELAECRNALHNGTSKIVHSQVQEHKACQLKQRGRNRACYGVFPNHREFSEESSPMFREMSIRAPAEYIWKVRLSSTGCPDTSTAI